MAREMLSSKSQVFIIGQAEIPSTNLLEANKTITLDISSVAAIIAAVAAIGTFVVTWRQLGKVATSLELQATAIESTAQSLKLQQLSIQASVILDCSKHYDLIISAIEEYRAGGKIDLWWYRLWGLYTKEFFFFKNGLIDKEIYEFCMIELAFKYHEKPFGYNDMKTLRESHKEYLENRISPAQTKINDFFAKIEQISVKWSHGGSTSDKVGISTDIHNLILESVATKP
jgi:hypothetical protein